jgi:hypothetical protein
MEELPPQKGKLELSDSLVGLRDQSVESFRAIVPTGLSALVLRTRRVTELLSSSSRRAIRMGQGRQARKTLHYCARRFERVE